MLSINKPYLTSCSQHLAGEVQEPVIESCSTRLVISGTIHGRAYVTAKATVADAQQVCLPSNINKNKA